MPTQNKDITITLSDEQFKNLTMDTIYVDSSLYKSINNNIPEICGKNIVSVGCNNGDIYNIDKFSDITKIEKRNESILIHHNTGKLILIPKYAVSYIEYRDN